MPRLLALLAFALLCRAQPVPSGVLWEDVDKDEKARDQRENLAEIIHALDLRAGAVVADIGAGYGYYAARFAPIVAPNGTVYAEEIDKGLIKWMAIRSRFQKLTNVKTVLGTPANPNLPRHTLDAVILADVYHEVDSPDPFLRHLREALKPGGLLLILDYLKPANRTQPRDKQRTEHNISPEFIESDLTRAGFELLRRQDPLATGYDEVPTFFVLARAPALRAR